MVATRIVVRKMDQEKTILAATTSEPFEIRLSSPVDESRGLQVGATIHGITLINTKFAIRNPQFEILSWFEVVGNCSNDLAIALAFTGEFLRGEGC